MCLSLAAGRKRYRISVSMTGCRAVQISITVRSILRSGERGGSFREYESVFLQGSSCRGVHYPSGHLQGRRLIAGRLGRGSFQSRESDFLLGRSMPRRGMVMHVMARMPVFTRTISIVMLFRAVAGTGTACQAARRIVAAVPALFLITARFLIVRVMSLRLIGETTRAAAVAVGQAVYRGRGKGTQQEDGGHDGALRVDPAVSDDPEHLFSGPEGVRPSSR